LRAIRYLELTSGKNPGGQKMTESGDTGAPTKGKSLINTTHSNIHHPDQK
jgi:hypothetical protein